VSDRTLIRLVQVALAATVLAIASGSSSVRWIIEHTRGGIRWATLFVLCGLALVWAARRGRNELFAFRPPALACAAFAGLVVLSTAWSVAPRLTFERAGTICVLFVAGAALAVAARDRPPAVVAVLTGLLGGVVAVAVASLLTLAFTYSNAVQPATNTYGARFQGYSQNPNTLGMLFAFGMPIAAWAIVAASSRGRRALIAAVWLLLFGELAATGSRGSLLAAAVGTVVVVALDRRPALQRVALATACLLAFAGGAAASALPKPTTAPPPATPTRLLNDAEVTFPLESELGAPKPGTAIQRRGLFSSSGRFQAWRGAIDQGDQRPVAGYGFGTESRVFVDRYYGLDSNVAENSYVGLYLQLGLAGLALFLFVVGRALVFGFRAAGAATTAVPPVAVVCAGMVLAVGQSFVYSVGATGTVPFWICVFLTSALTPKTT
jgi:O-antigen ligase